MSHLLDIDLSEGWLHPTLKALRFPSFPFDTTRAHNYPSAKSEVHEIPSAFC